jgi:hypothetical protein
MDDPDRSDHKYLVYMVGMDAVVRTFVSHGRGKDLNDNLPGLMARQCFLSKTQLLALINCTLSAEAYRQILIDKGVIKG